MKKIIQFVFIIFVILISQNINAQPGFYHPDSLSEVSLSGTILIDSTHQHNRYFLDTNSDGQAEYFLNFGPHWYEPDSSTAVRPNAGDSVEIAGGLHNGFFENVHVVIVYEINGMAWREPFDPKWNYFGKNARKGGRKMGNCRGYAFGRLPDSLRTVEFNGIALVDTTLFFNHYFIDVDNDTLPDYYLNFGPHWYEPASNVEHPENLDSISIKGGLIENNIMNMIVVYELNDSLWRDTSKFENNFAGNWIRRNMAQMRKIFSPFDPNDWITINPGWAPGQGGGMMFDSLFIQILELYSHNIPDPSDLKILSGYEIGIYGSDDRNFMWQGGNCGKNLKVRNNNQFQFHYSDEQLNEGNFDENTISIRYWDEQSNNWLIIENVQINILENIITFESDILSNYYIITADQSVVNVVEQNLISKFALEQNYPNPFNPTTSIIYQLAEAGKVELKIFDVLGREVQILVNEIQNAGNYKVNFDATNLPSGIYIYQIKAGNFVESKKMSLIK